MADSSASPAALRLRALAHPLRWKLFDIVFREGTATATRCAELTGESGASCSYHLNILGKYGYIEQLTRSGPSSAAMPSGRRTRRCVLPARGPPGCLSAPPSARSRERPRAPARRPVAAAELRAVLDR